MPLIEGHHILWPSSALGDNRISMKPTLSQRFRLYLATRWWWPGPNIGEWDCDPIWTDAGCRMWRLLPSGDYEYRLPTPTELDDYLSRNAW